MVMIATLIVQLAVMVEHIDIKDLIVVKEKIGCFKDHMDTSEVVFTQGALLIQKVLILYYACGTSLFHRQQQDLVYLNLD